ncbi:MAG: L-fuconolactonase, partial [Gammaproteobacteria bacterium]
MEISKIDGHVHFWQLARGDYAWLTGDMHAIQRDFSAADFEPLRKANNVSKIVLIQAAPTVAETRFLLGLAGHCDFAAGVVGKVDIEKGAVAHQQLAEFAANPLFCGIRPMIKNMGQNRWLELPGLEQTIAKLVELDLTFECMVRPSEIDELIVWLNKYSELRAVLCHGGMPDIAAGKYDYWADKITHLANETLVYCKLSGLTTLAADGCNVETLRPYVEHLVSSFGYERLIWGSDWPVMLCAGNYDDWCTLCDVLMAGLEEEQRQAIYVNNATHF